jgi:hypothetical protein
MKTYTYGPEEDPPREAGEFHCPGCLCCRVFWIAEGHEFNEEPDMECVRCGFTFTTFRNERTGRIQHQISRGQREVALEKLIAKRQGELLRAGFVREDVERVYSSPN